MEFHRENSIMAQVQPILLSAVTCNRVIFDKITGMASIIDIVQNINATNFPVRCGQLVFFCEMTNGHGRTETRIRLISSEDEEKAIFEQTGAVEFKDVKQTVSLAINLQGVVFPEPGEYRFQLFTGGQLLGERRIVCRKLSRKK